MSDAALQPPTLLPPNATPLERALARACAMPHTPEEIRKLYNPWACPVDLLPWLAWAWSVDEWESAWTEAQQRAMVAGSIKLHRKKGTPWAVREALLRSGLESVRIIERPHGAHWAEFDIDVAVVDRPLTPEAIDRAAALINEYKAKRSVLRTLRTSLQTRGTVLIGMQLLGGDTTTVYPMEPQDITPEQTPFGISFAAHDALITTVYPQ